MSSRKCYSFEHPSFVPTERTNVRSNFETPFVSFIWLASLLENDVEWQIKPLKEQRLSVEVDVAISIASIEFARRDSVVWHVELRIAFALKD